MSEYQVYCWSAVDRVLTAKERAAVNELSSHIDVSSSSATVEYNYGDFRHDPLKVLAKYFEIFCYDSNWGDRTVAFRFDPGSVEELALKAYATGKMTQVKKVGKSLLFVAGIYDEDGEASFWCDFDSSMGDRFTQIYSEILKGDYRGIFLLWLKARDMESGENDQEVFVPDGMGQLHEDHRTLIDLIELDSDLVAAAAAANPAKLSRQKSQNWEHVLEKLSEKEMRYYLSSLLKEPPHEVRNELRQDLRERQPAMEKPPNGRITTFADLKTNATAQREKEQRAEQKARERKRKSYLKKLAEHENRLWEKTDELITEKNTTAYEKAVLYLKGLEGLWEDRDDRPYFLGRVENIVRQYPRLNGLKRRMKEAGFFSERSQASKNRMEIWANLKRSEDGAIDFSGL